MKLQFKGFIVTIVLVFAFITLAGCGGDKKEVADQPTTGQAKEESIDEILAKAKQIEGRSFDYSYTQGKSVMKGKMWIQGQKVKNEMTAGGQKIIMISDGDTVYDYNPEENTATKSSLQNQAQNVNTPYDFYNYTENIDTSKIKELETVVYDGVKCKVFTIKDKNTEEEFKIWVREDYGIPARIEISITNGSKSVMEFKNLQVGSLPQDTFNLPEDVQIQDLIEVTTPAP